QRAHPRQTPTLPSAKGSARSSRLPRARVTCSLFSSFFHAPECCVDIRIMRLEPVSERPPQHACGSARRSAFHYVVLPIEKIRGITGIEGHGCKTGMRRENRSCPFPAVADQILDPECARARGMCSARRRLPVRKVEISKTRFGPSVAPRVGTLRVAAGYAIRRTMELFFGGQPAPQPFCVRRGFRLAHIGRVIQLQPLVAKHATLHPDVSVAIPECRMLDRIVFSPCPIGRGPQGTVMVSAVLDEQQKLPVRHVV